MNTANAVLQLHSRLRSVDEPTSTGNNNLMLKELENAVIMTQTVLTKITARFEISDLRDVYRKWLICAINSILETAPTMMAPQMAME
jgi:hypothetical protein